MSWALRAGGAFPAVLDGPPWPCPYVGGPSLSISPLGTFVAFLYVWLPYMVLPIAAALERIPAARFSKPRPSGAPPSPRPSRAWCGRSPCRGWRLDRSSPSPSPWETSWVPGALGDSSLYPSARPCWPTRAPPATCPWPRRLTVIPVVVMALYLAAAKRPGCAMPSRTGRLSPPVKLRRAGGRPVPARPLRHHPSLLLHHRGCVVPVPPAGLTLRWFGAAWDRPDVGAALGLSLRVATAATGLALVLGTFGISPIVVRQPPRAAPCRGPLRSCQSSTSRCDSDALSSAS